MYNIPIIIVAYCAENWFVVNTTGPGLSMPQ